MTNPMIRINDGNNNIVDREMNTEELIQFEADKATETARQVAEAQKAATKQALLARLGITEEEAGLLLS
jgi:hypothetical protein